MTTDLQVVGAGTGNGAEAPPRHPLQWVPEIAWVGLSLWLAVQLTMGGEIGYLGAGDPLNYLPVFECSGALDGLEWLLLFMVMLGMNLLLSLVLLFSSYFRYRGIRLLVCLGSLAFLLAGVAAIESATGRTFGEDRGMRAVAEWAEPIVSRLSAPVGAPADAEKLRELLRTFGTFDLRFNARQKLTTSARQKWTGPGAPLGRAMGLRRRDALALRG